MVILNWFSKTSGNLKFKYDHFDSKWVDISTVITTVILSYHPSTKMYVLDPANAMPLNEFVAKQTWQGPQISWITDYVLEYL